MCLKKENKRSQNLKKEGGWANLLYIIWVRNSQSLLQASAIAYKYKKSQKTQKMKFN